MALNDLITPMLVLKKITVRVFFTFLFVSAVFSCSNQGAKAKDNSAAEIPSYKVLQLQPRNATLNVDYPASIQGQQNIEIRPKVEGYIEKIFVDEGSVVTKGQLLFKISAPQYEQEVRTSLAGIKSAEADLALARMQLDKVKPLVQKDIISHYELDAAQFAEQSKAASLAQARATLVNAQTNLGYTTITSPVNGVVGSLPFKLGSLVNGTNTEPLTTIYNTANVYVYFAINEKQLLGLSRDSTGAVSLKTAISKLPDVSLILSDGTTYGYSGRVETVNGLINTSTGSANVRANFKNPQGLIRSGSSATIRIPNLVKSALLVPESATYELQDKRFVYVIDAQNKVKNVAIKIMDNTAGQFYVVTEGINPGDTIILESSINLKDGTVIKPELVNASSVYGDLK